MMTAPAATRPTPKLSRAEFARLVGKSKGRITDACKDELLAAVLPDGSLDPSHPAIDAYCTKRGIDVSLVRSPVGSVIVANKSIESTAPSENELAEIERILAPLNERYGSVLGLQDWLKCRKITAEVVRIESRNARDAGRIISRAGVEGAVFGFLHGLRANLRTAASTISIRAQSLARADENLEVITAYVRDAIDDEFRTTARSIQNILLNRCKAGDNPEPTRDEKESPNE